MQVRILVTHGIGFLPQCDVIVAMADGQITEVGSYNELLENDGEFAHFLQTYQNVEANEDENGTRHQLILAIVIVLLLQGHQTMLVFKGSPLNLVCH